MALSCFTNLFPCCCPWSECCELPAQVAPASESEVESEADSQNANPQPAAQPDDRVANAANRVLQVAPKKEEPKKVVDRGSPTPTPRTLAKMVVRTTTIQERSPAQQFSLGEMSALALKPLDTPYVPPSNVLETYNKPTLVRMNTDGLITQLQPESSIDNKGDGSVVKE